MLLSKLLEDDSHTSQSIKLFSKMNSLKSEKKNVFKQSPRSLLEPKTNESNSRVPLQKTARHFAHNIPSNSGVVTSDFCLYLMSVVNFGRIIICNALSILSQLKATFFWLIRFSISDEGHVLLL